MRAQIKMFKLRMNINRIFKFMAANRKQWRIEVIDMESQLGISVKPIVQQIKNDRIEGLSILQYLQTNTNNLHATPHQEDL